ncbi:hypothetical protein TNCV_4331231 [Trichonephila clavipes]|nr:hypothetical protein TNCV_4331231 [Trichonephila clavipes]
MEERQNAFEEHQERSGKENAAFFAARMKKERVCKEKLTDATAGVTKLEPALTLIPVLLLDIMIVQFWNEKVSNPGSIPITIDCNVVAFIVFEEGFHQPIKRPKQSVFLDATVFRHTIVD